MTYACLPVRNKIIRLRTAERKKMWRARLNTKQNENKKRKQKNRILNKCVKVTTQSALPIPRYTVRTSENIVKYTERK
jgi:hypothetical protein